MSVWISVAAVGGALALVGLAVLARRQRRGLETAGYVVACAVGFVSLVAWAVADALRPELASGATGIVLLLPGLLALLVVIRERRRSRQAG